MNDRDLYRGKRADNGEWVEGSLLETKPKHGCQSFILRTGYFTTDGQIAKIHDMIEVIPETVGQCTGRKMEGVLVFQGDKVRFKNGHNKNEFEVFWSDHTLGWRYRRNKETLMGCDIFFDEMEITGTIHE